MKLPVGKVLCVVCMSVSAAWAQAEEIDFTKREVTDPLLKIKTNTSLLPESSDKGLNAKRDEAHVPPVYRFLWGQRDVILLEPLSKEKPASIDFSEISKNAKGTFRVAVRNFPGADIIVEVYKGGQLFKKETIGSNKWERFTVPFDHEDIAVKAVANGWSWEFAFVDYSFSKGSQ